MSWANSQSFSLLAGCTRLLRPKVFHKLAGVTSPLSCKSSTICSCCTVFSFFTFTHFSACRCLMLSFLCTKFPLCAHFKYAFNIQMFNLFARCFIGPHFTSIDVRPSRRLYDKLHLKLNCQQPKSTIISQKLIIRLILATGASLCLLTFTTFCASEHTLPTCTDNH